MEQKYNQRDVTSTCVQFVAVTALPLNSKIFYPVSWKSRDGPSVFQRSFSSSRISSRQTVKRGILWNRLVYVYIAAFVPTDQRSSIESFQTNRHVLSQNRSAPGKMGCINNSVTGWSLLYMYYFSWESGTTWCGPGGYFY
jgi:hypothetical protein